MKKETIEQDKTDEAPAPKRIELQHPKMAGRARVWKKDLDAWIAKGWKRV